MPSIVSRLIHDAPLTAVAFGATADQLLVGGADGTVRVWDLLSGQARTSDTGSISAVSWLRPLESAGILAVQRGSVEYTGYVAWGESGRAVLLGGATGSVTRALTSKVETPTCATIDSTGRWVVLGGEYSRRGEIYTGSFIFGTPNGCLAILSLADRSAPPEKPPRGRPPEGAGRFMECPAAVQSTATLSVIFVDADRIRSVHADGTVVDWRLAAASERSVWKIPDCTSGILTAGLSADGALVATGFDGRFQVRGVPDGNLRLQRSRPGRLRPTSFSFDSSGRIVVAGWDDGRVDCHDLEQGAMRWEMPLATKPIRAVAVSPDGQRVAAVGDDGTASVVDLGADVRVSGASSTPREFLLGAERVAVVQGRPARLRRAVLERAESVVGEVTACCLVPGTDMMALGTASGELRLLSRSGGDGRVLIARPQSVRDQKPVSFLGASPDGSFLVSRGAEGRTFHPLRDVGEPTGMGSTSATVRSAAGRPEDAVVSLFQPPGIPRGASGDTKDARLLAADPGVTPDGRYRASAGEFQGHSRHGDGWLTQWVVVRPCNDERPTASWNNKGPPARVVGPQFLGDGRTVLWAWGRVVHLASPTEAVSELLMPTPVTALAATDDGELLLVGCGDGGTYLRSRNGETLRFLAGRCSAVTALAIARDSDAVAVGFYNGGADIWRLEWDSEKRFDARCTMSAAFFDDGPGPNSHYDLLLTVEVTASDTGSKRTAQVVAGRVQGACISFSPEARVVGISDDGRFVELEIRRPRDLRTTLTVDMADGRIVQRNDVT